MHSFILSLILLISSSFQSSALPQDFFTCLKTYKTSNGTVITQQSPTFSTVRQSMVQNVLAENRSPLNPTAILTPSHESEIQVAVRCSTLFNLQIRVRSGGHDFEGLSYLSQLPFIIIDLVNIRSISVDVKTKTAWVGGGATVGELYHALAIKSRTLAFASGTCVTIGVGGHFSGGGFGVMSRKHGLSGDNIIDAQIIDYKGRILDRRAMGEDLFWAIRGGGGGSFGIVTSWKVQLVTVPATVTVFNLTKTPDNHTIDLVHKWQSVAPEIDNNLFIRVLINKVGGVLQISFKSFFIGRAADLLKIMQKSFPELGLLASDCVEMSWIDSVLYHANFRKGDTIDVLLNRLVPTPVYFKIKSDYVTSPISKDGLGGLIKMLQQEDVPALIDLQWSPYGGKMAEISESSLPFPHRAGINYMIESIFVLSGPQSVDADRYLRWIDNYYKYMGTYVSKYPRRAYINFRDLDLGVNNFASNSTSKLSSFIEANKWGKRYFNNNFWRLVNVKSKVDPTNFFRHEQSIPPFMSFV